VGNLYCSFKAVRIQPDLMNSRINLFLILISFSLFSTASDQKNLLNIGFGDTLAPWVIPDFDQGILPDLLRATLADDYSLKFDYLPYARRILAWRSGKLDVVSDISPTQLANENLGGHYTGPVYVYNNIVVTLASKKLTLLHIDDLYSVSLLAWQGARHTMGNDYARMAKNNPNYNEHPNQKLQVKMLFASRLDAIQLDQRIFHYFREQIRQEGVYNASLPVRIAPIVNDLDAGFLFKDAHIRDLFMRRYNELSAQELSTIYAHYSPVAGANLH